MKGKLVSLLTAIMFAAVMLVAPAGVSAQPSENQMAAPTHHKTTHHKKVHHKKKHHKKVHHKKTHHKKSHHKKSHHKKNM